MGTRAWFPTTYFGRNDTHWPHRSGPSRHHESHTHRSGYCGIRLSFQQREKIMGIIRCIISKLVLSTFTMVAMKSVWETSAWRPNLPRSLPASGQGTAHDVPLVNVPLQPAERMRRPVIKFFIPNIGIFIRPNVRRKDYDRVLRMTTLRDRLKDATASVIGIVDKVTIGPACDFPSNLSCGMIGAWGDKNAK